MRVLVLGSGVIGVSSAWYLARAGFEVTVIDRAPGPGPAQETSFANAGQISPGYAAPWAAPGVPLKALKWLFSKDTGKRGRQSVSAWLDGDAPSSHADERLEPSTLTGDTPCHRHLKPAPVTIV